jgi:iron complex outermembrane receptor protein
MNPNHYCIKHLFIKKKQKQSIMRVAQLCLVLGGLLLSSMLIGQKTISGIIKTAKGEPIIGATVLIKGTSTGTITDLDGKYFLDVANNSAVLVFSHIGFQSQEIPVNDQTVIDVSLEEGTTLTEVVVVGYGTQRKKDLTGSVTSLTNENFQKGNIASVEQLANGKLAGVQITTNGGAPGSGSRIRIRGGASLNASNDPLIVIDGMPLDNSGVSGAANPLSFINPNDIETFTVLKDASATAIYGSRASNGVIMITTLKGKKGDALRFNFSTLLSSSHKTKVVDVLNGTEFKDLVTAKGTAAQKALLGTENTNWQDLIYRTAFSTDNNLSATGSLAKIPFRVSVGYLKQEGILLGDNMNRYSGSVGISPRLLNDDLRIDLNYKGALIKSLFANQGAIGSAVSFDPTQPVSGKSEFSGYFEWLDPSTKKPNTLAGRNPIALLNTRTDEGTVNRHIGNAQLNYRLPFFKDVRANLNVAFDKSTSDGFVRVDSTAAAEYTRQGVDRKYTQDRNNKTMQFYLNYLKELTNHRIDIMGGYEYQDFLREGTNLDKTMRGEIKENTRYKTQNTLLSYFGRANYGYQNKYLVTTTLRYDGSSRFSPETRWGLFPSVALAWRINEESFLKDSKIFSDLKLRLGYGVTGQQSLPNDLSDYPYLPRYVISESTAQYQFGNTFYTTFRPEGYDQNIKWEETVTKNAGLDFGFFDGRFGGSVDVYNRETKDLLSIIPVPAGSNLTNQILTNVGNMTNKGVELTLNAVPVKNNSLSWDVNFNVTFNENKITNLTKVASNNTTGILTGGISGGVGNTIQIHTVGLPRNAFYVWRQVYDSNGVPVDGLYADENGDGKISPDDRYRYKQADPRIFLGFSSALNVGNFNFGFTLRGSIDNYVYNNVNSNSGLFKQSSNPYLGNATRDVLNVNFTNNQYFSDYYLENGSFLRADNISFGYNLNNLLKDKHITARVSAIIQNAFVITKYSGIDPEIANGIDNNFYPRPRTYSLGLNIGF